MRQLPVLDVNLPRTTKCLCSIAAVSGGRRRVGIWLRSRMDRLSRSLPDLLKLVEHLTKRGVTVEFMKENLTFNGDDNAMSKMLLGVMGSIAQFERELMLERQREGIAKAKEAGAYKGGRSKLDAGQIQAIRDRRSAGESAGKLAAEFGITRQTVYNLVAAW